MCGIFGYVGNAETKIDVPGMTLAALKRLEYRGYDSWGIAVRNGVGLEVEKHVGKIGLAETTLPESTIGFGHTRWATHGGVTEPNAHPHQDESGRVALIHNGIVENYIMLKAGLIARGHTFRSDTDTEVIVHLVEEALVCADNPESDLTWAVRHAFRQLDGLNAVIAMQVDRQELVAVKSVSPLIVGISDDASYIASDVVALLEYTDRVVYLEDRQVATMTPGGLALSSLTDGTPLSIVEERVTWRPDDAGVGDYPDFMSKEMAEQSGIITRLADDHAALAQDLADRIEQSFGTFLLGCGTASYAALSGTYLFSRIARRHINFVLGSEFKYHEHFITPQSLVIALSQSGETADIIEGVNAARARGAQIGALVNVPGSSLARIADVVVPLTAGPEQCVLSTKAYTAKVAMLLLTAYAIAGRLEEGQALLRRAAVAVDEALNGECAQTVRDIAARIVGKDHLYVIGRGLAYPTALESALKIKEVSYMHAEGFAGGELKHGVIALIEQDTPCLVFAPMDETRADTLSGAMEMRARGGFIIGVSPEPDEAFHVHIPVADVGDASPLVNVIPAQLLGYHLALLRGFDPDKPRNLAKSVTVK
ncbi:MAG: glutamine--fructose-6-phosphate transaminase (isomerizing) [Chloroflexota bacterium]|nr:glutamine--fructose-6-phosphate transaminase (isomerizing) [Chloroflexota bacterium]